MKKKLYDNHLTRNTMHRNSKHLIRINKISFYLYTKNVYNMYVIRLNILLDIYSQNIRLVCQI